MNENVAPEGAEILDPKRAEEQQLLLGQMLASKIALDVIKGLQRDHPGTHPAIVTTALVQCLATVIKMFSGGDTGRALQGAEEAHGQLKQTVLSMMLSGGNARPKAN